MKRTSEVTPGGIVTSPAVLAVIVPVVLLLIPLVLLVSTRWRRPRQ